MLYHPNTSFPFVVTPQAFLGGFDVYDREETLGVELGTYDPNNNEDRCYVINTYCIPRLNDYSYRHKYILVKMLDDFINARKIYFNEVIEGDPEEHFSLPWVIKEPKVFFEDILKIAKESWKDELHKASLEDQSQW